MDAAVIVTYRCNAHCAMCKTWEHPTRPEEEISLDTIRKLPSGLGRCNITGGEPMLRKDIGEIVDVLSEKAQRLEISTNGYFTDQIVEIARRHPELTVRVSLEGLPKVNDQVRGIKDGFDHGFRTLLRLKEAGLKDIGFAVVVQDANAGELLDLFTLAEGLGVEFAQAVPHNSFYFHTHDNRIAEPERVSGEVERLMRAMLGSSRVKNWFRAYLNRGIVDYVRGAPRALPCSAGTDILFLDPWGEVYPCNGMERSMGNLRDASFDELWHGGRAGAVRDQVAACERDCWMTGTAVPAMKRNLAKCSAWVVKNKLLLHLGKQPRAGTVITCESRTSG